MKTEEIKAYRKRMARRSGQRIRYAKKADIDKLVDRVEDSVNTLSAALAEQYGGDINNGQTLRTAIFMIESQVHILELLRRPMTKKPYWRGSIFDKDSPYMK